MKTNIITSVSQDLDRPQEGTSSIFRFSCPDCKANMECLYADEEEVCLCGRTWKLSIYAFSEVEDDDEPEDDDASESDLGDPVSDSMVTWGDFKLAVEIKGVRDDQIIHGINFFPEDGRSTVTTDVFEDGSVYVEDDHDDQEEDER